MDCWIYGFVYFCNCIFGSLDFLEFWILKCGISGCLYSGPLDLLISAHQELHFRVP